MKKTAICFLIMFVALSPRLRAQGWYAEVDLDLNHGLYAFENISKATLTFSGVTVSGSSSNSNLNLVVKGTGAISGAISVSVNGTAFEPYDRSDPYSQPLSIQYSGKYDVPCQAAFFTKVGSVPNSELQIWIRIHPRLQIADFVQLCDQITLTTTTCSPMYSWEVSDSPTGNFKPLVGKSTSSIVVTRQELANLGFNSTYGRKYFRVSGLPNTTSQLQPIDIYYPGPAASFQISPPKCHNGGDGSITINIQSALPSAIDDYVITLFKSVPPAGQFLQDYVNDNSQKTFSGLETGRYWVRIENNSNISVYGNCWTDYSAGTLQNPEPVTVKSERSDYNGFGVTCVGASDGMLKTIPSGGSGTYVKYEWTPQVSTTSVANNLGAGSFQVKVSDSNGCWSESLTNVLSEPKQVSVQLTSTGGKNGYDVSCHNKADGMIEATASGGIPAYTYLWSDRNITPWIRNLTVGDYSVSVKDANGCAANANISLKAPPPIDFGISQVNAIHCPGDKTGSLEIASVTNTIGQSFYSWSSGEVEKAIASKGSGTYTATVSDDQGCSVTKSYTLTEPAVHTAEIIPISDFNGAAIRCNGTATGRLQAVVRDATRTVVAGQDFIWYKNGNFYQSGQHLETLDDVDAGTYEAVIRYTAYCTSSASHVLTEPEVLTTKILPVSDYNGVPVSCNGKADGSIKAEASGGTGEVSFVWSTGETTAVVTGLTEGSYSVTASDANGCTANDETILTEPAPVETSIAVLSDYHGAAISCADASDAHLGASAKGGIAPYTYAWSTGQTGSEIANIPKGTYFLTVVDANGCVDQTESSIIAPAPVRAAIIETSDYHGYGISCTGSRDGFMRAAGSGGVGDYTYYWPGTNASTPLSTNLGTGRHSVVIQDANGCSASAEAPLSEPDPVTVTALAVNNVSCNEGSDGEIELIADGGTGTYTYSSDGVDWQPQPRLIGLTAAVYRAAIQDENGCIATSVQTLLEPSPIAISFQNVSPALCGDPQGKISATVMGGTADYQYLWTDADTNMVGIGPAVSSLYAGIYSLTVTDANQCQSTRAVGITSTDGPAIHVAEITSTTCSYRDDGKAMIEVVSGDGPFSFLWQDGQTTAEAVWLARGAHVVEIRDVNNCAAVATVTIPAPDSLIVELKEQTGPQCFGDCNGSISVAAHGGTGPYVYDWGTSMGPEFRNLCSGAYSVIVTDQNACMASQTFNLIQPEPVAINVISQQSPSCPEYCDGMVELNATGGTGDLSFAWSNGKTASQVNNLCAGVISANVTDTRGCSATQTLTLETPQVPTLDLGGSITLCEGQTHTLDAGADWTRHSWSANNGFSSASRTVTLSEAAMYWLEAVTFKGCIVRDTFILQTSTDLLKANFLMPSKAFIGDTIVMIDISWPIPESAVWKFPEAMDLLESPADMMYGMFDDAGDYRISLSATLGACRDELTKIITILNRDAAPSEEGRLGNEEFVKEFTLYPNPNDGMFDVVAEFREESPIVLTIWNVLTSTRIARVDGSPNTRHRQHIDLRPLSAGSYSLRLDYSHGTKYIRFIVR